VRRSPPGSCEPRWRSVRASSLACARWSPGLPSKWSRSAETHRGTRRWSNREHCVGGCRQPSCTSHRRDGTAHARRRNASPQSARSRTRPRATDRPAVAEALLSQPLDPSGSQPAHAAATHDIASILASSPSGPVVTTVDQGNRRRPATRKATPHAGEASARALPLARRREDGPVMGETGFGVGELFAAGRTQVPLSAGASVASGAA